MSIINFLHQHAIDQVWEDPHRDRQVYVRMSRLSKLPGVSGSQLVLSFNNYPLPHSGTTWHLFELGTITPSRLGIFQPFTGWVELENLVAREHLLLQVFSEGLQCSLLGGWIIQLQNKNILIALPAVTNEHVLNNSAPVYARFYSNQQLTAGTQLDVTQTWGVTVTADTAPLLAFIAEAATVSSDITDDPLIYFNGQLLVDGVQNHNTIPIDTVLEAVRDPTISRRTLLPLDGLDSYTSQMDSTLKTVVSLEQITGHRYVDDIDVYITAIRDTDQRRMGVYIPRLHPKVMRTLTQSDWGIHSGIIESALDDLRDLPNSGNISSVALLLIQRDSTYEHPVITDSNRIPVLLTLPLERRRQALTGINATLSLWRAAELEQCPVNVWGGLTATEILVENVFGVFSRTAGIRTIEHVQLDANGTDWGLPPMVVNGGGSLITHGSIGNGITLLQFGVLTQAGTMYPNGKGYEIFRPSYDTTAGLDLHIPAGATVPVILDGGFNTLIYYITDKPQLATRGIEYTLEDNPDGTYSVVWSAEITTYDRYVRTAQTQVEYLITLNHVEMLAGWGLYQDTIVTWDVGMSQLLLWVNNIFMIEGLDYHVMDGRIWLVTLKLDYTQVIQVQGFYSGLPPSTLQHEPATVWGWVSDGRLENRHRLASSVRSNKLLYIDGRAIPISSLDLGNIVDGTGGIPSDGAPYVILDRVQWSRDDELDVLLKPVVTDAGTDVQVNEYLAYVYPEVPVPAPIIITRYQLFSPLISKLLDVLASGTLIIDEANLSMVKLQFLLEPYIYLLSIDPSQHQLDPIMVEIQPDCIQHVVTVSTFGAEFLNRVNSDILGGTVSNITQYINVV